MSSLLENISDIGISEVVDGAIVRELHQASMLWSEAPVVIYVVRRPGCAYCREDAQELSSRFGTGEGSKGGAGAIRLVGIVKEVDADPEGVDEFQKKYFNNNTLYIDMKKEFYQALGNKSLFSQSWHSWNPITLYKDFNKLNQRMKNKKIEGNLKGEGFLKGGLFVVSPKEGIVYVHSEETGSEMPYAEIERVVAKLLGVEASKEEGAEQKASATEKMTQEGAVCKSREACGEN